MLKAKGRDSDVQFKNFCYGGVLFFCLGKLRKIKKLLPTFFRTRAPVTGRVFLYCLAIDENPGSIGGKGTLR